MATSTKGERVNLNIRIEKLNLERAVLYRALLAQQPGLALQFLTSSENVKFSRWQADFAVRLVEKRKIKKEEPAAPPPPEGRSSWRITSRA